MCFSSLLDDLSRHLARETNLKQELKEITLFFLVADDVDVCSFAKRRGSV